MPIDPFDPGTSVAQNFPTQEPDTFRRLAQILAAQKREMFDLRASVLANVSGIVADLTAKQAALAAQNAQILALIGSQLSPLTNHADATGIALVPGANVELARVTITIPTGYTQALVIAVNTLSAKNSTAASDDMYGATNINGTLPGWSSQTTVAAGKVGVVAAAAVKLLTGISGTFYVSLVGSTAVGVWPSVPTYGNINIDVMTIFLR